MSKTTLIAIHNILLNAKPAKYAAPGTRFQIGSKDAKRLISLGAARMPKAADAVEDDESVKVDTTSAVVPDEDRVAVITRAIEGLDDTDYDAHGKPKVGRVNTALPEGTAKTNVAERDAVWATMSKPNDDDLV